MKRTALVMTALVVAMAGFGSALADVAPVTMQPIPNPPEKPMKPHGHMTKHAKKAPPMAAPDTGAH